MKYFGQLLHIYYGATKLQFKNEAYQEFNSKYHRDDEMMMYDNKSFYCHKYGMTALFKNGRQTASLHRERDISSQDLFQS